MQTVTDWKINIIKENNDKNKRKYRIDKNNQKLKSYEEVNNYKVNDNEENDNENDVKNNVEMNNAKKIIKIFNE